MLKNSNKPEIFVAISHYYSGHCTAYVYIEYIICPHQQIHAIRLTQAVREHRVRSSVNPNVSVGGETAGIEGAKATMVGVAEKATLANREIKASKVGAGTREKMGRMEIAGTAAIKEKGEESVMTGTKETRASVA